jgi:hypothetical protein
MNQIIKQYDKFIEYCKENNIKVFEGLNSEHTLNPPKPQRKLTKGYVGEYYHIFLDEELEIVEVLELVIDEFGNKKTVKRNIYTKSEI